MIHYEHTLQRAIVVFCKRCVAVPHEFAAHDRAAPRSPTDHIYQARRGIRTGWPDTELLLEGGRTFRCELKQPGRKLEDESRQADVLVRMNDLGHHAAWANSVEMYGEMCEQSGVPLRANWRTVAQLADAHVAASIRKQQAAAAPKPAPIVKPKHVGKPSGAQIRKAEAIRMRYLPR